MMTTLTVDAMSTLDASRGFRPRRGVLCGVLVGAFFGFAFTGHPIAAAAVYTFTPVTCLFDYAL